MLSTTLRTKYLVQNTGCKQNNYGTIRTWRYGGWGWSEGDFREATPQKYWNMLCWCFPKAFSCHLVFVRCSVDTNTQLLEHRDNSGLCPPLMCMSGLINSVWDTILLPTGDESEMRCQHHSLKKTPSFIIKSCKQRSGCPIMSNNFVLNSVIEIVFNWL